VCGAGAPCVRVLAYVPVCVLGCVPIIVNVSIQVSVFVSVPVSVLFNVPVSFQVWLTFCVLDSVLISFPSQYPSQCLTR